MQVTDEVGAHRALFLELEGQASGPYSSFVYSSAQQAAEIRRFLFEEQVAEYSPPHGRLLLDDGEGIGMVACLSAEEVGRCRLRSAFAMAKTRFLREDPGLQRRLRIAGQVLLKPRKRDFYLSRIAVREDARGKGAAGILMDHFEEEALKRGCTRLVLEVSPTSHAARRLYERRGFTELDLLRGEDPDSGRQLEYIHMEKKLD